MELRNHAADEKKLLYTYKKLDLQYLQRLTNKLRCNGKNSPTLSLFFDLSVFLTWNVQFELFLLSRQ